MTPRCSVGKLDNSSEKMKSDLTTCPRPPSSSTAVPQQNREDPRQYMTFNKFTRDEYVFPSPLLFSRSHAHSTIQLSQRPCLFAPRLLNGKSPKSTI